MNTAKQVNIMIGLLLVAFLAFATYFVTEPAREQAARETQDATMAERGATLFVNNCRPCHGLEGQGPDDGGIAPKLHNVAFLVLDAKNPFNLPKTVDGEAKGIHDFLFDTISCGRTNTAMPPWAQSHGGSLANIQIEYIVSMITQGRWDLVKEIGDEHDKLALDAEAAAFSMYGKSYAAPVPADAVTADQKKAVDKAIAYKDPKAKKFADLPAADRKTVLENYKKTIYADPTGVTITSKNCGQYGAAAQDFRDRNPFGAPAAAGGGAASSDPVKLGQTAAQANGCAACHSVTGGAGVGPTWKGLAGSKVDLADGSSVTADDAFLKESIENPNAKIVKGFAAGIMPQEIAKQLKPGDIDNIIAYIKSLK